MPKRWKSAAKDSQIKIISHLLTAVERKRERVKIFGKMAGLERGCGERFPLPRSWLEICRRVQRVAARPPRPLKITRAHSAENTSLATLIAQRKRRARARGRQEAPGFLSQVSRARVCRNGGRFKVHRLSPEQNERTLHLLQAPSRVRR